MRRLSSLALLAALAACRSSAPQDSAPSPAAEPLAEAPPEPVSDAPAEQAGLLPPSRLEVGMAAPTVDVDAWVKGEPVPWLLRGQIFVVVFWASWSASSIEAIPHLARLQEEHPEVVVFAVASDERPPEESEPDLRLERLRLFVERHTDSVRFRVAYDGLARMKLRWMLPAKLRSIPCAFLVDRAGRVVWIGHPLEIDAELERLLASEPQTGVAP